jgi:hypothetical protein
MEKSLIGRWEFMGISGLCCEFASNGKYKMSNSNTTTDEGKYEIYGDSLSLHSSMDGKTLTTRFGVQNQGENLALFDAPLPGLKRVK